MSGRLLLAGGRGEAWASPGIRSGGLLGDVLPAWAPGTLDIHQIVTGRDNAAFVMFPDGTTLLLDAGDAGGTESDGY